MAKETTYAGKLGDWQRLLDSLAANATELAHLEVPRTKLVAQLQQALTLNRSQAAVKATKQDLSQQLGEAIGEGDRLATLLRSAIKQHFGIRAERLTEFGVQPFRGKARKPAPVPIEVQQPPARTAAPADAALYTPPSETPRPAGARFGAPPPFSCPDSKELARPCALSADGGSCLQRRSVSGDVDRFLGIWSVVARCGPFSLDLDGICRCRPFSRDMDRICRQGPFSLDADRFPGRWSAVARQGLFSLDMECRRCPARAGHPPPARPDPPLV
jgi:hypothetical protein